jgi:hypothetical protein
MKRTLCVIGAALLFSAGALAQGKSDDARAYFNIGAKSYQAGKYKDAITAFEEAYKRAQRPGLLFSLGQANRMQFFKDSDSARLREAVRYYREYLQKESGGKRAGEATEALEKLVPLLEKLSDPESGPPSAPAATANKPRVMVSSPTEGAQIIFDGRLVEGSTFISEVAPGKHKVVIRAPGHEDYTREVNVDAVAGAPPIDVALTEKPAEVVVVAPEGAEIAVDGRFIGLAPQPALKLPAGSHFLAVTQNGRRAFTKTMRLRRGEKQKLVVDLESTGQRTTAWITLGVGTGALIGSGVLGALALKAESDAEAILDDAEGPGNAKASALGDYEQKRDDRDRFRLGSFILGGAGLAFVGTSIVLFSFDEPRVQVPELDRSTGPTPKQPPTAPTSMEISMTSLGPSGSALSLRGRF